MGRWVDKRALLLLHLNGLRLSVSQVDATLTMLAVAAGEMDEAGFAAWLRNNCKERG